MVIENRIELKNIYLNYPLLDYSKSSLKLTTLNLFTGGNVSLLSNEPVVNALENISLDIYHGEKIGLYGHNGSGKTSLLRIIAGIFNPQKGSVKVLGNISSMLSIDLGVDIYETGIENIKLKGKILKFSKPQIDSMIEKIAEFSELGEFLKLPLSTYSSGMLVRFQFALATYKVNDIILLDEWLSAGDENFAPKAEKKMREIIAKSGILVIASHNFELLKRVCTKIVYLEKGRIKKIERV